jgi:hypothetical protein
LRCLTIDVKAMRLLLLLPNVVLMIISGYNLADELSWKDEPNYLVFKILHILVMLLCLSLSGMIIRSVFSFSKSEGSSENAEVFESIDNQQPEMV